MRGFCGRLGVRLGGVGRGLFRRLWFMRFTGLLLSVRGRETAVLRASLLEKDFKVVKVDVEVAKCSAELRHRYRVPLADSVIAITASLLKAVCFSDDPHFEKIREIKTRWL